MHLFSFLQVFLLLRALLQNLCILRHTTNFTHWNKLNLVFVFFFLCVLLEEQFPKYFDDEKIKISKEIKLFIRANEAIAHLVLQVYDDNVTHIFSYHKICM